MKSDKTDQAHIIAAGAPDEILAELWEVKREINRAADYRIDTLAQWPMNLPNASGSNGDRGKGVR